MFRNQLVSQPFSFHCQKSSEWSTCIAFLQETLRTALAMGADRGIHVEVPAKDPIGPLHVSIFAFLLS